jgi:gliding motility associated protien GldN
MNWKVYYLVFVALLVTSYSNSQSNLLNATEVDQIGKQTKEKIAADNDTPLSYGYIDDRDILWSKVVWEFVDLNQKINLPYYYPIDTANISNDRRSLFDTLLKGIRKG